MLRVDEVDEILSVLVGPGTELLDLVQHETPALGLVPDLLVLVHDDEQVGLLVARVHQELLGREREVVFRRDDEYDDVNLLLSREDTGSVSVVTVETRGINERDVDNAVVEERCLMAAGIRKVDLEHLLLIFVLGHDRVQIGKASASECTLIRGRVSYALLQDMDLLLATILRRVVDLAESRGTRLLVDRHDLSAEQSVHKRGLASVEVASDEDLG